MPELPADNQEPETAAKREWQIFVIPAVLAVMGYLFFYSCDARLRTGKGPWEVTFSRGNDGTPLLRIDQPALRISNVVVRFPGESVTDSNVVLPATVRFDAPERAVPFGTLAFHDLMYQPGTLVLHCFGHEVQMIPSKLYLNRQGHPWEPGQTFDLQPGMQVTNLVPAPESRRRAPTVAEPPPLPRPGE